VPVCPDLTRVRAFASLQDVTRRHPLPAQDVNCFPAMSEPSRIDDPLATDEARRNLRHDAVKANVESDVNAEMAVHASQPRPPGAARKMEQVVGTFREHAVDEVIDSEHAVRRSRGVARASQFIDYAFFLIYALLAIRFVLALIAARSNAGFVQFIVSLTGPLYAPFKSIVASPKIGDGHTLPLPMLVAIGAYLVLHIAINRLLRLIAVRKTEI
jgi:uncharacterized protein YggT (Ycf19 family)